MVAPASEPGHPASEAELSPRPTPTRGGCRRGPDGGRSACRSFAPCRGWGHAQGVSLCFPRVEEDLDQILNLGAETQPQPQPKRKPPVAAKPALPRKPAVPARAGLPEAAARQQQQQIQAMDEMDILQYIRDHDTPGQAAPSLF